MSETLTFGERLRQLRELCGYTREELGSRSGVSAGYIYRLETGKRPRPSHITIMKLARGLVLPSNIFDDVGEVGEEQIRARENSSMTVEVPVDEPYRASFLAIGELSPDDRRRVAVVVDAMVEDLKRRRREEDEAERRRRAAQEPGPGSKD